MLAEDKLRTTVLIVAAGAWQSCWDQRHTIGFQSNSQQSKCMDRNSLLKSISPELLQRFRAEVIFLSPMKNNDHLNVMEVQLERVPEIRRNQYEILISKGKPSAGECGLGMRMFEEENASSAEFVATGWFG